ncbi:MAG TPA: 2OG-Fe(II) oxygenase [Thermoanaerobaculia bacterium]
MGPASPAPPAPLTESEVAPAWRTVIERVLDGLAERGFAVVEDAFPGAFLDDLAAEAHAAWRDGDYRRAGVGRGADRLPEVRSDHILWLDPAAPTALQARYLDALDHLRDAVRRQLYLPVHEVEAHFAVYPPGAFYRRHLDQFRQTPHRLVSCLLYLDRGWRSEDGGQLRLYHPAPGGAEARLDVLPERGTFVCFLSDRIEHEVLPTARPRTSLAAWLRREGP